MVPMQASEDYHEDQICQSHKLNRFRHIEVRLEKLWKLLMGAVQR